MKILLLLALETTILAINELFSTGVQHTILQILETERYSCAIKLFYWHWKACNICFLLVATIKGSLSEH